MTEISEVRYDANVTLPSGENLLPKFRDPRHDTIVTAKPEVPEKYTRLMGLDCGRRLLPYTMLDRYDRNRRKESLDAVVLENNLIKATFLLDYGCRLISLIDKTDGNKELLFANKSLQVANLSTRDAWFAGGIEWNIGQYGHAFSSMGRIHVTKQTGTDGQQFLRIYDYERCKGIWWHIDFHLSDDAPLLYAHVVAHNLYDEPTSMYYWTNSAVYLTDDTRIFASNDHAVYLDPYAPSISRNYGFMDMPDLPVHGGIDASFPNRIPYSDEYFFTCDEDEMPWESAFETNTGKGFFEASTHPLSYRKMFCWGVATGGKNWQRFLCPDSDTDYVEIQAGLAPSQTHGLHLDAHATMSWTQAFGPVLGDPGKLNDKDYKQAKLEAQERIHDVINAKTLRDLEEKCIHDAEVAPEEILCQGTGWGYLEQKMRGLSLPKAFHFDQSSVKNAEMPWDYFLDHGQLPTVNETPYAFQVVVNSEWRQKLQKAVENIKVPHSQIRAVMLHYLGIALLEDEQVVEAKQCWLDVYDIDPNPWTVRNIAVLELRRGAVELALEWYAKAAKAKDFQRSLPFVEEYFRVLVDNGRTEAAVAYFKSLPPSYLEQSDTIALDRAKLAAQSDDAQTIKRLAFDRLLCNIREGDTPLEPLWEEYVRITGTPEVFPSDRDFSLYDPKRLPIQS